MIAAMTTGCLNRVETNICGFRFHISMCPLDKVETSVKSVGKLCFFLKFSFEAVNVEATHFLIVECMFTQK